MALYASAAGKSTLPPHPAEQYAATCIDVIDHGYVDSNYQGTVSKKHKCTIRFWCGEYHTKEDGETVPLYVGARFTVSLHENSALRPFLEKWRGRKFTAEELHKFDVESLIGAPAFVQITHNQTGEKTYANIESIMRLPKGVEPPDPLTSYVRVKDRQPAEATALDRAFANAAKDARPEVESWFDDDNEPF